MEIFSLGQVTIISCTEVWVHDKIYSLEEYTVPQDTKDSDFLYFLVYNHEFSRDLSIA